MSKNSLHARGSGTGTRTQTGFGGQTKPIFHSKEDCVELECAELNYSLRECWLFRENWLLELGGVREKAAGREKTAPVLARTYQEQVCWSRNE
ncbi:60S ribosomal protein L36a [Lemmus lemmus]